LVGDLRVVKQGMAADERVVVNGMARVRPGLKVTAQQQPPAGAPVKPTAANAPASPAKTD